MTSPAPLLAVVLLALLVGAAIPVLYQLHRVLKRTRALLDTAGPRLERALEQVGQAADRVGEVGSTLEAQARTLEPLLDAASRVGRSIGRTGDWLGRGISVGGTIGLAAIAGLGAFFSRGDRRRRSKDRPASRSNGGDGFGDQLHD